MKPQSDESVVTVVFRYDDCSAKSSLQLERRFLQAFADCGGRVTMGVIPFVCKGDFHDPSPQRHLSLPDEKAAMLRAAARAGTVEIALHGCYHQVWNDHRHSEYAGLGFDEQVRRLRKGKDDLERRLGVSVTTLIPPWNAYDETTVRAMADVGLNCLSASLHGPFSEDRGVRFLPASCWLQGLLLVLSAARKLRGARPVIVVMMHDFDFFESGLEGSWLSIEDFAALLRRVANQPGVRLASLGEACRAGMAFGSTDLIAHQRWRRLVRRLSYHYRVLFEDQVLCAVQNPHQSPLGVWWRQTYISLHKARHRAGPALTRRFRKMARLVGI